jgi:hypothetical protein
MTEQIPSVPEPVSIPVPPQTQPGDRRGLAIASLVLGILSLCASILWFCGGPISIVGLVLGVMGLKSSLRGLAIAGIVLSAIGLLLVIVFGIIGLISIPFIQQFQNQYLPTLQYELMPTPQ